MLSFETESLIYHLLLDWLTSEPLDLLHLPSFQGCRWVSLWLFFYIGSGSITQHSKHYPPNHLPSSREMGLTWPSSMGLYSPTQKFRKRL